MELESLQRSLFGAWNHEFLKEVHEKAEIVYGQYEYGITELNSVAIGLLSEKLNNLKKNVVDDSN